ncbi:MAG: DUF1801 domain-containing protein [Gemmatimonadota bacterium]
MTTRDTQTKRNAGGNPYIPKGDGDESVQAYIDAMPGWHQGTGQWIDRLVEEHVPEVRKAVRWNTPFYGLAGRGWFLAFYCYAHYVQVTFFKGVQLDPLPPKASKQDHVRYLAITEDRDLSEDQLVSWIQQAAALPGEDVF